MRVRATRLFAISGGGRRLAVNVFAGSAAAYSMRIPANSDYNGPLARVRRSNDNAELDIGAAGAQVALNRNFATASGWSLGTGVTYGTNQLVLVNAGIIAGQNMGLVTGRSYQFSIIVNKTGAGPTSAMRISTGNSPTVETGPTTVIATNPPNGLNVFRAVITANGPCLVISADTNIFSGSINFVSVQETNAIPGQNAWLNEYALLGHVTVNSGFVTTWYDQSGNARHATQTLTGSQPSIVNAGSVSVQNGVPIVVYGIGKSLFATTGLASLSLTLNAVGTPGAASSSTEDNRFISVGTHNGTTFVAGGISIKIANGNLRSTTYTFADFPSTSAPAGTPLIGSTTLSSSQVFFEYKNGTQFATGSSNIAAGNSNGVVGQGAISIQETMFFRYVPDISSRLFLERNQGTAYGITVA